MLGYVHCTSSINIFNSILIWRLLLLSNENMIITRYTQGPHNLYTYKPTYFCSCLNTACAPRDNEFKYDFLVRAGIVPLKMFFFF